MVKTYATPLTVKSLPHATLNQFLSTSNKVLERTAIDWTGLEQAKQLIEQVETERLQFEALLQQEKIISGVELKKADKLRGTDLRNIMSLAKVYQHSRQANKKAAVDELTEFLNPYRTIYKENYEKETAAIHNILSHLEKSPYREKIALIGGKEFVDNLRQSQEQFYQLYLTYGKFKKMEKTKTMSQQKQVVVKQYETLYHYLISLVAINEQSSAKLLLQALNEVRMDYKTRYKKSKKKTGQGPLPLLDLKEKNTKKPATKTDKSA